MRAHRRSCKTRQPVLGLYWKAATESHWTVSIMVSYKQQSFLKQAVEKEKGDFTESGNKWELFTDCKQFHFCSPTVQMNNKVQKHEVDLKK